MKKYEVIKNVVTSEMHEVEAKNWKDARDFVNSEKSKPFKTIVSKVTIKSIKRLDKTNKEKTKQKETVKKTIKEVKE